MPVVGWTRITSSVTRWPDCFFKYLAIYKDLFLPKSIQKVPNKGSQLCQISNLPLQSGHTEFTSLGMLFCQGPITDVLSTNDNSFNVWGNPSFFQLECRNQNWLFANTICLKNTLVWCDGYYHRTGAWRRKSVELLRVPIAMTHVQFMS